MAKLSLSKPTSGYNLAAINANFTAIESEFQNKVLYRDNPVGEANTLQTDVDANSKNIYNVGTLSALTSISVAGVDLSTKLVEASASAAASAASAVLSSNYAADSLASANNADASEASALSYSNSSAASYALTATIASAFAGGTVGFDAIAYDWGSVGDATTYFNRDFGLIV